MPNKALTDNKEKKDNPLLDSRTDEQKENDRKSEEQIQEAKSKSPDEQASIDFDKKQQEDRDRMAGDRNSGSNQPSGTDSTDPKDNAVDYASHHDDPLAIAPENQTDNTPKQSEFVRGDVVTYTEPKEVAERRDRDQREKSGYRVYKNIDEEKEHLESRRERRSENLDIKPRTVAGRVHSVENERLPNGELGEPAFVRIVFVNDNMDAEHMTAPIADVKKI